MLTRNFAAVDAALDALHEVSVPAELGADERPSCPHRCLRTRPTSSSA